MPKQPINFENLLIYKIFCKDENIKDIYVGRTTDFIRRKQAHKSACNCQNKNKQEIHNFINDNGGWNNWEMEIIEKYPCSNSINADEREQYWINTLQATLNVQIKFSDVEYKKDWYFKNRERIRIKQELYRKQQEQLKIERQKYLEEFKINYENVECNPEWFQNNVRNQKINKIK